MGTLYLVRHGQASFGADDYDLLSPLGQQQAVRLGEYFKYKGLTFEAALTGTLTRQRQTLAGICQGMGVAFDSERLAGASTAETAKSAGEPERSAGPPQASSAPSGGSEAHEVASVGAHLLWPGLNEYDSEAVISAIHPYPLKKPDTPELYRHHFRLLKDGLAQWMAGVVSPRGMPRYTEFAAGVAGALEHIRSSYDGNVLLVSSGGPIATAVGQVMGSSPEATIELNMRIRNSSVTEFAFSPKRHRLVTYNTLPHLDAPEYASWVTYA
ncbi:MAG: histidine phosphatase family protein [Polaromonas sp.]|uniref:histidine phosphatase family protein n=1 Tax=Polaromonas sp. TaxID=1869339 RepID=UPI0027310735|nr:histidine phosphatase family protein [Polaromonas sp.]MDP2256404.1 histidine phosphatase family protein [Polaromonas sp.]MDP3709962.1 histidine phosphatase family protein [Polaromonas sp.]